MTCGRPCACIGPSRIRDASRSCTTLGLSPRCESPTAGDVQAAPRPRECHRPRAYPLFVAHAFMGARILLGTALKIRTLDDFPALAAGGEVPHEVMEEARHLCNPVGSECPCKRSCQTPDVLQVFRERLPI